MPKYLRKGYKAKKSDAQGVALEGGGIGGTGSAKIDKKGKQRAVIQ
jgi:hypothetical protein